MEFTKKVALLHNAIAPMQSSKELCLNDALELASKGDMVYANQRIEKAASYAWGFWRPAGW